MINKKILNITIILLLFITLTSCNELNRIPQPLDDKTKCSLNTYSAKFIEESFNIKDNAVFEISNGLVILLQKQKKQQFYTLTFLEYNKQKIDTYKNTINVFQALENNTFLSNNQDYMTQHITLVYPKGKEHYYSSYLYDGNSFEAPFFVGRSGVYQYETIQKALKTVPKYNYFVYSYPPQDVLFCIDGIPYR